MPPEDKGLCRCGRRLERVEGSEDFCVGCYGSSESCVCSEADRLLAAAGVSPGAAPGSSGAAEGSSETSSAQTVDVHGLYDFILRTDAGPGDCGYIIGKVGDLTRELEQARRDNARLREEARAADLERDQAASRVMVLEQQVAAQRDAAAGWQQAMAEAAERAWGLEQELAKLGAGPAVRRLLEKNARTIKVLRMELFWLRGGGQTWQGENTVAARPRSSFADWERVCRGARWLP